MAFLLFDDREDVVEQDEPATALLEVVGGTEDDGVDWCAWWAEYDEVME